MKEEAKLYDEVDDDQYKDHVRGHINAPDFVVDDNGEGYADDGREDWQDEQNQGGSETGNDDDVPAKGKSGRNHR